MLTEKAAAERAWAGMQVVRSVLESRRDEFDGQLYPTSISDSEFDHYRRSLYLAGLVDTFRDDLLAAFVEGAQRRNRDERAVAVRELEHLRAAVGACEHRARAAGRALEQLCDDLQRLKQVGNE